MANDVMSNLQAYIAETGPTGSVQSETPNSMNRYMGGHRRINHPFVSGYWYFFIAPPEKLFGGTSPALRTTEWFHSAAESFTPPSRSLIKVDVPGMGGMASSFVAGQEIGRTFSVAFREYQNLPITSSIDTWTSLMDKHLGVSPLKGEEYIPSNYKGEAFAILTRPTISGDDQHTNIQINDIEQLYYMSGVFPENTTHDSFASDISGNDVLQLTVNFSFDGGFYTRESKAVLEKAIKMLNAVADTENIRTQIHPDVVPDTLMEQHTEAVRGEVG